MKTYKDKISKLEQNQVFVFGSNPIGVNGSINTGKGGAALHALINGWVYQGEKMNNCISKSGKAWGIVTVTQPGKRKSKTLDDIKKNISILYDYALENPNTEFFIAYTGQIGNNLNGYSNKQLADCFNQGNIPNNIIFEEEFSKLICNKKGLFF